MLIEDNLRISFVADKGGRSIRKLKKNESINREEKYKNSQNGEEKYKNSQNGSY